MTRTQHAELIRTAAMQRAMEVCRIVEVADELMLAAVYAEVLVEMLTDERTTGFHHNGTNRQFEMKPAPPEPVT